ncbi:MAG: hypothetical protein J0J11_05960, partial [Microbacterium sp.]|nr:hypothetical protein [Microbacterium sp.]
VQIAHSPVAIKVAGVTARPGATVRLRLVRTDIGSGTIDLDQVASAS